MKKLEPITITDARSMFPTMLQNLSEDNEQVITKDNIPALVVMSWKRFRALSEFYALLSTQPTFSAIEKAAARAVAGLDLMSSAEMKAKLQALKKRASHPMPVVARQTR